MISRLTLDHVKATGTTVRLHLGREPAIHPEPLAGLVRQLAEAAPPSETREPLHSSSQAGNLDAPSAPTSSLNACASLASAPGTRSTALFQLATDLPAAILARLLGIHISVAATWQRASAGDWTNYAAEVSRRTQPPGQAFRQF